MFKKIKMIILETRLRWYGKKRDRYRCKVMKYKYYSDLLYEYTQKILETEDEYQNLFRTEQA